MSKSPFYVLGPGGGLYLDYTGGRREMQGRAGQRVKGEK